MKKRIAFNTLGCKLNFAETSFIANKFRESENYKLVDFQSQADIYVINSCTVTKNAEKKCDKLIKSSINKNQNADIVIIGCSAQINPERYDNQPVKIIIGNEKKYDLKEYLEEKNSVQKIINTKSEQIKTFQSSFSLATRTRSFLKIQDGCDYFCSFCAIPRARGRSRSDSIDNILQNAQKIIKNGVKEIVLTGINIGEYKSPQNEDFYDLMQQLDRIDGIERIRISSIEPNLITDEIIKLVEISNKFLPHFHVPLQSGSNRILKLMKRKYNAEFFINKMKKIKEKIPDAFLGIDVIVGFPDEQEEDFQNTYELLNNLDISYLHIFPYSQRPNTLAQGIKNVIPEQTKKYRSGELKKLSDKKYAEFYAKNIGKKQKVLFEKANINGRMNGFTENYIKVTIPYDPQKANQIIEMKLR